MPFSFQKYLLTIFWLLSFLHNNLAQKTSDSITTIAFGSCAQQDKPQPILGMVADLKPDFFIYLGDNVYGDTYDMKELKAKYTKLASKTEFQKLKANTKLLATWDDHDFGWNDSGRHYPMKEASKQIFMDFFQEPQESERLKRPGIYNSYFHQYGNRILQIILLDTRTFRDNLINFDPVAGHKTDFFYNPDYIQHQNADSTLLGETQWKWLEAELSKKADVRIIGSSTQFGIEYNGYEAWANFPNEMNRMTQLIKKTRAEGVIFISGDVHYAEISKRQFDQLYPIYDFTSSGITSTWDFPTRNKYRIEGPVMENHFGLITINWSSVIPSIKMEVIDIDGNQRIEYTFLLDQLSFWH